MDERTNRPLSDSFGRLMQSLDSAGIADETLVVFTTDHGIPFPRAKATLYDAGLTTALLVRWPERGWVGGEVYDALLSNLDIYPTLLQACALPVSEPVHGRSFVGLLDGDAYEANAAIFAEQNYHGGTVFFDPRRAVRTTTHKRLQTSRRPHHPCAMATLKPSPN